MIVMCARVIEWEERLKRANEADQRNGNMLCHETTFREIEVMGSTLTNAPMVPF